MSKRLTGKRILMRIFLGESDKAQEGPFAGKPLWEAILKEFKQRGFAGTTVIRGMAGFGANARERSVLSEYLSLDLPVVVEVVETQENIDAVLPDLDRMIGAGLITLEHVDVIVYRSSNSD